MRNEQLVVANRQQWGNIYGLTLASTGLFMNADELAINGQLNPSAPMLSKTEREEFWTDTCREMTQMQMSSQRVIDLYRKYGCRFCAPTRQQVQHVINALDSAMSSWEIDHPELFYQTLELNFPELVRRA